MIISYFPALYTCFCMTVCPDHYPGCTYLAVSLCLKSVCVMFVSKGVFYYSNHVCLHMYLLLNLLINAVVACHLIFVCTLL